MENIENNVLYMKHARKAASEHQTAKSVICQAGYNSLAQPAN
jgi:hypothetical protein